MATDFDRILMLYIESITGTISPEDAALLQAQLQSDMQVKAFWEQLEQEGKQMALPDFVMGIDPAGSNIELKEKIVSRQHRSKRTLRLGTRISIAASIIILFGAGWFFYKKNKKITDTKTIASLVGENKNAVSLQLGSGKTVYLNSKTQQKISVGNTVLNVNAQNLQFTPAADTSTNTLNIPKGENYSITLSDGTLVILNAASCLRFPFHFASTTRDVYLSGEAYFKVAKDKLHPFIVHTPLTKIQVVGTEFNVNSYNRGTVATSLIEGKVLTEAADGAHVPLSPGHAALYSLAKGFDIEPIDTDDVIAWIKGVYYFHNEPFAALCEKMARVYGVAIQIDNPSVSDKSVSGIMDRNNLSELLEDLKMTTGINYYYAAKELHIQ